MINGWPILQGDHPCLVPYARADGRFVPGSSLKEWYYPTVSYHHMLADMISDMWSFERRTTMPDKRARSQGPRQGWKSAEKLWKNTTLKHRDVFTEFVMPQMMSPQTNWDNLCCEIEQDARLVGHHLLVFLSDGMYDLLMSFTCQ